VESGPSPHQVPQLARGRRGGSEKRREGLASPDLVEKAAFECCCLVLTSGRARLPEYGLVR
jgi:hypothetical protein